MIKGGWLGKRGLAVLEDFLNCEVDEEKIRVKHRISRRKFRELVSSRFFQAEVDRRVEWLKRRSEILVARCQWTAATKLAEAMKSLAGEKAWKGCLDIIRLSGGGVRKIEASGKVERADQPQTVLEPQTASKILSVLAKEKGKKG